MPKNEESLLADLLFPTPNEEVLDSILNIPPEQRRLHTDTYDFSISTILDYLESGNMYIPEFQRRSVWNNSQSSRLIESLIIQCPIPVIYLSQNRDERLAVIDGNQRLTAIRTYIRNQFPLKGLTAYPELEGFHFFELDSRFQRHIMNRTLRCIVITKDTHPQVKFDVFERLNSGAVKLTPQELRHGIYYGKFMEFIEQLGKNKEWRSLLSKTTERRMRNEELIIRFLAFHFNLENYKKPLTGFLNDFAEKNKDISDEDIKRYTDIFTHTVKGVKSIYGDLAFKIFDSNRDPVNNFNAALFDAEMLSVSRSGIKDLEIDDSKRDHLYDDLYGLFIQEDFAKSITRATSDVVNITRRIEMIRSVLREYI
jgi:hypothetical protein